MNTRPIRLAIAAVLCTAPILAQDMPNIGFQSVGRGRPLVASVHDQQPVGLGWTGNAFVFWKDHGAMGDDLKDGATGPGVLWLKNALTTLGFYQGSPTSDYDMNLHVAVAAFQAAHGLTSDGIVGEQTKMLLYSLIDSYSSPRLTASR